MKIRLRWQDDERVKVFTEAQRILDTGWEGSRLLLFTQAQGVLPDARRYGKFHSSHLSYLSQQLKDWKKTGSPAVLQPATTKPARKKYTRRNKPAQSDTALFGTEKVPHPFNFCPGCGFDLRQVKFESA